MFYRLKDGFALRGYQNLVGVLIKRPYNQYKVLSKDQFNMLLLCDGKTDFESFESLLTNNQKECLKRMLDAKIIEKFESPIPIGDDSCYHIYNNRFFKSFFWSITGKCNFKCRHCFIDAPTGKLGELSHNDAINLIDEIADCGGLVIDITGGEPFIRLDFFELIDHILSKKIYISQIYTNGYLLSKEILQKFVDRNIFPEFLFSFDVLGWHDWMRMVDGAEKKVIDSIKLCVKMGFPVSCEVCLHKNSVDKFGETVRFLSSIGVDNIKASGISNTPLWKKYNDGCTMSFQEYLDKMIEYIPQFYKDGMPCNVMLSNVISMYKEQKEYTLIPYSCNKNECDENRYLCGSIRSNCYIAPDGRIVPCMPMLSTENSNVFSRFQDVGLKNILSKKNSLYMTYIDKRIKNLIKENKECANCEYVYSCGGGCRAVAFTDTGNLMGIDKNTCFIWKNGYAEKIANVAKEAVEKYCDIGEDK